MKRDKLIQKINIFMETLSDGQLNLLDEKIRELISTSDFYNLSEPENRNFTTNGLPNFKDDIEEGNWGTLYRTPDNG